MTFTAGRACGPRTWRRPTRTRREGTSPAGDRVAVGTVQVGIGTPGLTFIRGDGIFYGPFGWGFYSPWLVYEAPYFAYGYPFGYGPYHRHFGGYRPLYTPRDHPPGSAARSFSGGGRVGSLSRGAFGGPGGRVAVLVEVQASLKGVSTAATIAKIHPSFVTKRYRGIHLGGPAGRQVAG